MFDLDYKNYTEILLLNIKKKLYVIRKGFFMLQKFENMKHLDYGIKKLYLNFDDIFYIYYKLLFIY